MIVDLHNHTPRCNHAEGNLEEFVDKAILNGTRFFGFSDHAPMYFDEKYRMGLVEVQDYEKEILALREKYKNHIKVLLGYEVDYLEGYVLDEVLKRDVDYLIGSVHFIGKWGFDNPEFIGEYKSKNIDKVWEDYFLAIENLAKSGKFDIVGHLDLIKIFKFYPIQEIKKISEKAILEIKRANMCVEVNMAGFRKPVVEQYPSKELLELILENDIPITFGSDAHRPNEVGLNSEKGLAIIRDLGFKKCAVYEGRDRELINF